MTASDTGHADSGKPQVSPRDRRGRLAWNGSPVKRANLVVMLVASVAVLVVSCGSDGDDPGSAPGWSPPTSTTRLLEEAPAPDPSTPEGVAVTALHEIFTWHPATEGEGAALARAREWLGPSLIRTLDSTATAVETPKASVRWAEWGSAGATVEAFTFASGVAAPGTDPNRQQYKIGIEQTVVYPDGRREPLPPTTVVATVVRTADGWRLDEFR